MKKNRTYRAAAFVMAAISLSGVTACVSGLGANDYERGVVGQVSRVDTGILIAARPVNIEPSKSNIGTAAGAAIGGIAASNIGGSKSDNLLAGAAGALVGGLVGSAASGALTKKKGFAYTVRLDKNNEVITVTQGGDVAIPVGMPVLVEYGARTRILPRRGGGYGAQQPYQQPYYDQDGRPMPAPQPQPYGRPQPRPQPRPYYAPTPKPRKP